MKFKAYLAEFIATFTLVFVGVGAIAANHITNGGSGLVGIALAHGIAIAVMVSATAAISGGHVNPAVTIGLLCAGKIDIKNAFWYVVFQCLGAIAAAFLIKSSIPETVLMHASVNMGTPALAAGISEASGIITEIVLTFFLVFVVYGTAVDKRAPQVGGLFIGLAVTMDILIGGPLTGAAMNPARHLGPALLGGGTHHIWLYWLAPVIGGIAAALCYKHFLEEA